MKAAEARLLDFIKKSPQFVIPIYQRQYSWTDRECRQLWDDIMRTGRNDSISAHFIGSIVYVEKGLYQVTSQSPLLVIDGQQRLTTITLLLAALREVLKERPETDQEVIDGFSPKKLHNYYLVNPEEDDDRHYKLILSETDEYTLKSIVKGLNPPKDYSIKIDENYKKFKEWILGHIDDLETICKGIAKLIVVDIALSRDQDNPQLIFESMNSTGRELTQADLIRNYILMGLDHDFQSLLYKKFWRPMEIEFGQEAYGSHFDYFMRHYLTIKTGDIPRLNDIYDAFKSYARKTEIEEVGVEWLLADILQYANYYTAMALGKEDDKNLDAAFHDLRELKVDVAYPLLLELYHDYTRNFLTRDELETVVRLIEAYVFRRAICSIPTNSLNKTFATFTRGLKRDQYVESVKAKFLLLPSYRRFPSNEEFKRELKTRDLYNFPRRTYWLRRLENYGRKERVMVDEYTIEHIMPQNKNLPHQWRDDLGDDWESIHETWLHTLGNLTLTGYNSEYSDKPFKEKRDMEGGFAHSPLRLNKGLGEISVWNKEQIKLRAERLSEQAIAVWAVPKLEDDTLEQYRPHTEEKAEYSIEDHPFLSAGSQMYGDSVPRLFDAFRNEVKSLDPVVSEEFLKLYVAYKAETNFVDVVPQARRLILYLNMDYQDIVDPKNICRDVTGMGKWGNGNVELYYSSLEELSYIVGLVRQAFERQMGNGYNYIE